MASSTATAHLATLHPSCEARNGDKNKLCLEDREAHDWYRFVLSYPAHLVKDYLERFGGSARQTALDPFCGTGTTLVECKKLGFSSIGVEANPMAHFASQVKTDWSVDPEGLAEHARRAAEVAGRRIKKLAARHGQAGLRFLPAESEALLLKNSISPVPLHKTLVLLDVLGEMADPRFRRHELLALASAVVNGISNLHFGPEVGVRGTKEDAPVVEMWLEHVTAMAGDLKRLAGGKNVPCAVHLNDSRRIQEVLEPRSVDLVITSPPYPNEKDYTRTTRLESVILGFLHDREGLRDLKKGLLRSNTRNVYKGDDDDRLVESNPEVQRIAKEIEARRLALGKTSGFERMYHRVAKLYFGGMTRHFMDLRTVLRPGAKLAYVVGDQASYLRVMIRTGQILGDIAASLGYRLVGLDLFRTRLATATREQLREEVLLLEWPG